MRTLFASRAVIFTLIVTLSIAASALCTNAVHARWESRVVQECTAKQVCRPIQKTTQDCRMVQVCQLQPKTTTQCQTTSQCQMATRMVPLCQPVTNCVQGRCTTTQNCRQVAQQQQVCQPQQVCRPVTTSGQVCGPQQQCQPKAATTQECKAEQQCQNVTKQVWVPDPVQQAPVANKAITPTPLGNGTGSAANLTPAQQQELTRIKQQALDIQAKLNAYQAQQSPAAAPGGAQRQTPTPGVPGTQTGSAIATGSPANLTPAQQQELARIKQQALDIQTKLNAYQAQPSPAAAPGGTQRQTPTPGVQGTPSGNAIATGSPNQGKTTPSSGVTQPSASEAQKIQELQAYKKQLEEKLKGLQAQKQAQDQQEINEMRRQEVTSPAAGGPTAASGPQSTHPLSAQILGAFQEPTAQGGNPAMVQPDYNRAQQQSSTAPTALEQIERIARGEPPLPGGSSTVQQQPVAIGSANPIVALPTPTGQITPGGQNSVTLLPELKDPKNWVTLMPKSSTTPQAVATPQPDTWRQPPSTFSAPSTTGATSQPLAGLRQRDYNPIPIPKAQIISSTPDKPAAQAALTYARLSRDAYETNGVTADGYRRESTVERNSGFAAAVFVKAQPGSGAKEIVIAYRGTEPTSIRDWTTNVGANFMRPGGSVYPKQYAEALELYQSVRAVNPEARIILTGHSLGGGLASYVGNQTGQPAVTFNAARNAFSERGSGVSQTNFSIASDVVGDPYTQSFTGSGSLPGRNYSLSGTPNQSSIIGAHGMDGVIAGLERAAE